MNAALWKKTVADARWLLLGCMVFMFAVHWLRVWVSSFFTSDAVEGMLSFIPSLFEQAMPVPFSQVATPAGRIAVAYDDPIVLLLMTVWAISRGSDAVSGELNRGTMEMLLAQPVTRLGVLFTQAAVTLGGGFILASTAWMGTAVGIATIKLNDPVAASVFLPAALNLFSFTVFLAGLTTMVSSAGNFRSRTIGIVGGFYAVSMLIKIIGRVAPGWGWLTYISFFSPFEPQLLVSSPARAWSFWMIDSTHRGHLGALGYDSILIVLGLVCYLVSGVIFQRRDLPAPL